LKMGDVLVTTNAVAGDFGLTGEVSVQRLDYNSAAAGFARLNWATAFDAPVDPSAALGLAAGTLAIDFPSALQFGLVGAIAGNGQVGDPGEGADNPADNALIFAGPVTIGGTVGFAVERYTADVDTDGNGTADLF